VELLVRVPPEAERDKQAVAEAVELLCADLRREGVTAERTRRVGPSPNSKSGAALTLGSLLVYGLLSPTAVVAFTKVIVSFLHRQSARKIIIEHGDNRIEIDGSSAVTQRAALEAWCSARLAATEQSSTDMH
jgi:hypothetical protein